MLQPHGIVTMLRTTTTIKTRLILKQVSPKLEPLKVEQEWSKEHILARHGIYDLTLNA